MEWQQIKGFRSVARLGSMTKAARCTLRSQSAVSQQIKALEDELGHELLERLGRRRLRLSPAGERLNEYCGLVLEEYERLRQDLAEMKGQARGRLRVGAPFTTLYQLLPDYVLTYLRENPLVELSVWDRPQNEVIRLLTEGEVDLGIVLESRVPPELAKMRWKKVQPMAMLPKGHPLAWAKRLNLAKLAAEPLILPPPGPGRSRLEEGFNRLGLEYRVVMESSNVELSSLYVEKGLGVSFATVIQGAPWLKQKNLAFVPLAGDFPPDHLAIAMRPRKRLLPHQKAFLAHLTKRAGKGK
ncbi:hypothetical protein AAU61_03090 [Desulfocarbo indianensis]|nr:hypothetical protein AAU61_03090 [Desulfocarbo indianensis]